MKSPTSCVHQVSKFLLLMPGLVLPVGILLFLMQVLLLLMPTLVLLIAILLSMMWILLLHTVS